MVTEHRIWYDVSAMRLRLSLTYFFLISAPALACRNDSDLGASEQGLRDFVSEQYGLLQPTLSILVPVLALLLLFAFLDRRRK